jgi:hypothetical protein
VKYFKQQSLSVKSLAPPEPIIGIERRQRVTAEVSDADSVAT